MATRKKQVDRYIGVIEGNFEYTATWSENHRHQCEVDEIARLPQQSEVDERLQAIRVKRGEAAMQAIAKDVKARRHELFKHPRSDRTAKTPSFKNVADLF